MRKVFVCMACAIHYLPPESMRYADLGLDASPVHCSNPDCRALITSRRAIHGVPLSVLERWALRMAERQPHPRIPRKTRGRRPSTQKGTRGRLG